MNECEVGCTGFQGVFLCTKNLQKMKKIKLKNDYVLIAVTKHYLPELDIDLLLCDYSNGLRDLRLEVCFGDEIKTILPYDGLD